MTEHLTTWRPDTCHCSIQIAKDGQIFNVLKQCKLHKNLKGTKLLDEVRKHNHKHAYAHLKNDDEVRMAKADLKNKT